MALPNRQRRERLCSALASALTDSIFALSPYLAHVYFARRLRYPILWSFLARQICNLYHFIPVTSYSKLFLLDNIMRAQPFLLLDHLVAHRPYT